MAALSDAARREIWARFMRENDEVVSITKAELRAAFDAIDDWQQSNAATINAAIPQPARGALSPAQKARIFTLIAEQRYVERA